MMNVTYYHNSITTYVYHDNDHYHDTFKDYATTSPYVLEIL